MSEDTVEVRTESAPAPIGPYSQAIRSDGFLFVSGQLGIDVATGAVVKGGAAAEAEQVLRNMSAIVSSAGATMHDVVKVTIFLREMGDFVQVNEVYGRHFSSWRPARSTIGGLQLPKGALVEMDAVVRLRK